MTAVQQKYLFALCVFMFCLRRFFGRGAQGAAHLINAGKNSRTDSDYHHNAKYDILKHNKNLHI